MIKAKKNLPIPNSKVKENNLPPLQRKILIHLAEHGPKTRNEVSDRIGSAYKSILFAFKSLQKKGFIQIVSHKYHRNQGFPQFWLTVNGVGLALLNNANPEKVRENALKSFKKSEDKTAIEVYFKVRESAGPKVAKVLDKLIYSIGKIELPDLLMKLTPQLLSISETEVMKVFDAARKTEYWKLTEEKIKSMMEALGKVLSYE